MEVKDLHAQNALFLGNRSRGKNTFFGSKRRTSITTPQRVRGKSGQLRQDMLLSKSRRVCTHALCKHGSGLYKQNAKFEGKLFCTSKSSDRDLLLEYTTLSSFASKTWNLMFDPRERNTYFDMQKSGVLSSDSYFSPVWTYLCLQNPLLQRYNIEGADIIEGAKFSYDAITKALSSKDFYDHLRGDIEQSESDELLASVQSPEVYKAWRVSTKQFDDTGMRFTLKKLDIQQVALRNIVTKIVPGDIPAGTEYMTDLERSLYVEFTQKFSGTKVVDRNSQPSSTVDKLEPPSADQAVSSSADKPTATSAASSVTTGATSAAIDTQTPTTNTAAIAASLLKQTPSTPSTPVSASTTTATSPVSSEGFKVQPATRRTNRAVIAVRTGDETNPNTTVPGISEDATTTNSNNSCRVVNGEHAHVPPITAEGTPVKANDANESETEEPATPEPEETVVQKTGYARDYEIFPPGSVLAYVDVQYKVFEESEIVVQGKSEDGEKTSMTLPQKKVRDVMWSFRGCISGQVPLEWTLVDINGPRAMSFKV